MSDDNTTNAPEVTDQGEAVENVDDTATDGPVTLPDDHPLVRALAAQKDEIKALKEKSRRLDEIDEAQKSDAERAAEALATAKAEAAEATAELLRYRTAAAHGITDSEDIELFLTGKDEETLERQAKALSARIAAGSGPRAPKPDPNQGRSGASPATTADQFASAIESQFSR